MRVQSPSAHPQNFPSLDSMAGVCNLAHIWERKKLCHSFCNAVDLLLAVCILVQEVADMLFHLDPPCSLLGSLCTRLLDCLPRFLGLKQDRLQQSWHLFALLQVLKDIGVHCLDFSALMGPSGLATTFGAPSLLLGQFVLGCRVSL